MLVLAGGGWPRRVLALGVALLCLLLLSACGFKLRGSGIDTHYIPVIYVESERGSYLSAELQRVFFQAGVTVVEQRDQAVWHLTLSDERRQRRVLSVGSRGKVQEYELYYGLSYRVTERDGRVVIEKQTLTLLRSFSFSGTDVLAKAGEEARLYEGMQQQAAQRILRHLSALQQQQVKARGQVQASEVVNDAGAAVLTP